VAKLLFILIMAGALVEGLASSHSEPPLLIDASPTATLDAAN
jgi:hypothetical protein